MQTKQHCSLEIEDLVLQYYPAVVRLALAILDDDPREYPGGLPAVDEAEDVAQETFIAAARSLEDFRGLASPKTWLFSIAINTCRSRLRKRKAQRRLVQVLGLAQRLFGQQDGSGQGAASGVEHRVERDERDRQLWSVVDGLSEKHRLVVVLRYVHELDSAKIAEVLRISEGTVHSRLHYARQRLAEKLRGIAILEEVEAQ